MQAVPIVFFSCLFSKSSLKVLVVDCWVIGGWGMVEMRNLFGSMARSTSAPAGYDQIDDTSEGRLKVHAEEAFRAGIKFKARFIGSLEIPKVYSETGTKNSEN